MLKKKLTQEIKEQEVKKPMDNPINANALPKSVSEPISRPAEPSESEEINLIWSKLEELVKVAGGLSMRIDELAGQKPVVEAPPKSEQPSFKIPEKIKLSVDEEVANIKSLFEDFDIRAVYNSDKEFKKELNKSGSAYFAFLKHLAKKLKKQGYFAGAFVENGAMPAFAAGDVNASPAGLPDNAFDDYINNIMGI